MSAASDRYFSANYPEARDRFLRSAAPAGAVMRREIHPTCTGPRGEPLSIDVARFGAADAPNVLVTICGTHGIEAYPGSAAQVQWVTTGAPASLPGHVSVLVIHGLNPWGWAHDTQLNEDLVDLNRNFIDFSHLPFADPLYDRIAAAIAIDCPSYGAMEAAVSRIAALRNEIGAQAFMNLAARGQYHVPGALKYGGVKASWSNNVLRKLVREELATARKVFMLDWHTGLGDWGHSFELCVCKAGTKEWDVTASAWGEIAVRRGQAGWSTVDSGGGATVPAPALSGVVQSAFWDALPGVPMAGGAVEFGTWPWDTIVGSVVIDHWMHYVAPRHQADVRPWRAQMRTWFSPRDDQWESDVLGRAQALFGSSLEALASW